MKKLVKKLLNLEQMKQVKGGPSGYPVDMFGTGHGTAPKAKWKTTTTTSTSTNS